MLLALLECADVGMVGLVKKNSLAFFLVISEASVEQELLADQDTSAVLLRIFELSKISDAASGFLKSFNN